MKIRLSEVARVKKAEIVLDGITVVAGNNGCGKSTISKSLYTILESSYDVSGKIRQQQIRSAGSVFVQWLNNLPSKTTESLRGVSLIRMILRRQGLDQQQFSSKVSKVFAEIDVDEIKQHTDYLYEQYVEVYNKTPEQYMNYIAQVVVDEVFSHQINTLNKNTLARIEYVEDSTNIIEILNNSTKSVNCVEQNIQPIYITTSDLMDTVGNNKKLYSAQKVDGVSYANTKLVELLMQEKAAKDFTVEEYEQLQKQKEETGKILQQVLQGDMHVEKGSLVYYDEWVGGNVAFGNVASGIRIFLILKKLIDNGVFLKPTCLIIDEPETNLHPEWQLRLAELLVLLHENMAIRVYTNTHSPYFARAIEFYAHEHNVLDKCKFYLMDAFEDTEMYASNDVTMKLGLLYDMLAEPFNKIM